MTTLLVVKYDCALCGTMGREVGVRYREADEDIRAFMEDVVITGVAKDHAQRSPHCRATTITNLYVPVPAGTDGIGERPAT